MGCGKIGHLLAEKLAEKDHRVVAIKRTESFKISILNYSLIYLDISNPLEVNSLDTDFSIVVFIVSPQQRNLVHYQKVFQIGLQNLINHFSNNNNAVGWFFISSTRVYQQANTQWVNEKSLAEPQDGIARVLRDAEKLLLNMTENRVIIRFSGIYGPNRYRLLNQISQGQKINFHPDYYTNRIHFEDCIGVLIFLIEKYCLHESLDDCYLASDNVPVTMGKLVAWLAERMTIAKPEFDNQSSASQLNKRCQNKRLVDLGYEFRYPSYQEGFIAVINDYMNKGLV